MRVGFAGLGLMGRPMAINLARAGLPLTVWNRSPEAAEALRKVGAAVAPALDAFFDASDLVVLMLADDRATDFVLGRGTEAFQGRVAGRLVVDMGTHDPDYVRTLSEDVATAGGTFVEAPVSGSRAPAEAGRLVAMLGGPPDAVARVAPILAPMCAAIIPVGCPPSATLTKLAVNAFLIASVAALAEATALTERLGLDVHVFRDVLCAGPLGSTVVETKLSKMVAGEFSPQATIRDVCKNAGLVARAARNANAEHSMLAEAARRFDAVLAEGGGDEDMAAVITAFRPNGLRRPK